MGMVRRSGGGGLTDRSLSTVLAKRIAGLKLKSPISRHRLLGTGSAMSGAYTVFGCYSAPEHYDAVRIVLISLTNDTTNSFKASVAPSASYNDGVNPVDGSGSAITPIAVTWGSTNYKSTRNPGGGAASTTITGASGTSPNQIESRAYSDIIPVTSLARTDFPNRKPLLMVRLYGTNVPGMASSGLSGVAASSYKQINPDHWCQYIQNVDNVATVSGVTVQNTLATTQWAPSIEILYYLRGKRVYTIAGTGDSIDMGWGNSSATNTSAGNMNGWQRQFAALVGGGFTSWHRDGFTGTRFNEEAMNALLFENGQGITHLFIKCSSVNNYRSSPATVTADLARVTHMLGLCYDNGIVPILVYPWAGQDVGSAPEIAIRAYIDGAKASGVHTFDARELLSASSSINDNNIKPEYLTRDSSNNIVDPTHLNAAAEAAIANLAYNTRLDWGII